MAFIQNKQWNCHAVQLYEFYRQDVVLDFSERDKIVGSITTEQSSMMRAYLALLSN